MKYHAGVNHSAQPFCRDTRIDVFRSLALLTIFINHIPGTLYEHITHKNFGFSDSAEVFVLLSGISLGLSFHGRLQQKPFAFILRKYWQRAFQLYGAYLLTTFVTLSLLALKQGKKSLFSLFGWFVQQCISCWLCYGFA